MELESARIFEDLLGVRPVGVTDDFFELGGHSLLALQAVARIHQRTGRRLPLTQLMSAPTVERLASELEHQEARASSCLVEIQPKGSKPPMFWVHPAGGHVLCYLELSDPRGSLLRTT